MNHETAMTQRMTYGNAASIVAQFVGTGNVVAVPIILVQLTGDFTAAAFLSQCLYWSERTTAEDRSFFKTGDDWQAELRITPKTVRRCVDACEGIVQVQLRGLPARNYYTVNRGLLMTRLLEVAQQDAPKGHNLGDQRAQQVSNQRSQLVTETTSETTHREKEKDMSTGVDAASSTHTDQSATNNPPSPDQDKKKTGKASGRVNQATALEDVARAQPLFDAYNANRGKLPKASSLNPERTKLLCRLLDLYGEDALTMLVKATCFVAANEALCKFYRANAHGLTTLANDDGAKVVKYSEAQDNKTGDADATPMNRRSYE